MSKKERKLTPAEQRRKAAYQELSAALEQQGYEKRELTIGVLAANLGSLLLTFPLILALSHSPRGQRRPHPPLLGLLPPPAPGADCPP